MTGRSHLGIAASALLGAPLALLLPPGTEVAAADAPVLNGIHKIQHVVIIMQENRSFDSWKYYVAEGTQPDSTTTK